MALTKRKGRFRMRMRRERRRWDILSRTRFGSSVKSQSMSTTQPDEEEEEEEKERGGKSTQDARDTPHLIKDSYSPIEESGS